MSSKKVATLQDLITELEIRSGSVVWVTKDNKVIAVKDMTNEHLRNTIKLIINGRKAFEEMMTDLDECGMYDPTIND